MSLRQVLTIFNAERQLSDEETALLNTLRKMTDAERELLGGSLAPQAKPKPRKKREVKSAHASSLQQQIASTATNNGRERCGYIWPEGARVGESCNAWDINPVHDKDAGYAGYHPFASSSSARSAAGRSSSKNGSQTESGASTEGGGVSVLSVVGG